MLHIAIFLCKEDLILIRNVQSVEIKYFYCSVHDCFAYLLILAFNVQDVIMKNTNTKPRGMQESSGNVGLDSTWLGR